MNSLGFKQSNILTDIRLAIGFTACAIAGATFYYDYTLGWDKTKVYTLYAVVAYFTLNTLLTWWIWWVQGGKVYIGERDGVKVLSPGAIFWARGGEGGLEAKC
jgi:signal peptidase complex subunit 2